MGKSNGIINLSSQFVIYGSYFFIMGAVFLARAVFHMTRVGWRRCWQQRYEIQNQPLTVMEDLNEGATTEPVGLNTEVLSDELADNTQN